MTSIFGFINRLLPFATPGTPIAQDLIHLGAICAILYFAPQIQEWYQRRQPHGDIGAGNAQGNGEQDTVRTDVPREEDGPINQAVQADREEIERPNVAHDVAHDAFADQEGLHDEPARDGQPGPAQQRGIPTQRNVGAKKAKSLARRDQRRQYHEFMRSQGEAERARDAEGAAEREAQIAAEQERRKAAAAAVEAKKAKEREQKREAERMEREAEIRRRELVIQLVRDALDECQLCDLFKVAKQVGGDVDEEWVERILKAAGLIGKKADVLTLITEAGWVARVTEADVQSLYKEALSSESGVEDGSLSFEGLGKLLESVLTRKSAAYSG